MKYRNFKIAHIRNPYYYMINKIYQTCDYGPSKFEIINDTRQIYFPITAVVEVQISDSYYEI